MRTLKCLWDHNSNLEFCTVYFVLFSNLIPLNQSFAQSYVVFSHFHQAVCGAWSHGAVYKSHVFSLRGLSKYPILLEVIFLTDFGEPVSGQKVET